MLRYINARKTGGGGGGDGRSPSNIKPDGNMLPPLNPFTVHSSHGGDGPSGPSSYYMNRIMSVCPSVCLFTFKLLLGK